MRTQETFTIKLLDCAHKIGLVLHKVHTMNNSDVISLDLAKNIIQVCNISKHGELISNRTIKSEIIAISF